MKLIVTMAGEYTRFLDFSSEIPKYLLPVKDGLVLDYILRSYAGENMFDEVVLVCNEKDKKFHKIVEERLSYFSKAVSKLIYIKSSASQIDTAIHGIDNIEVNSTPLLIANIDTILLSRDFSTIKKHLESADGLIDTFTAYDKAYSYVMVNENNDIINIKEKIQISSTAASGLYGFRSSKHFLNLYNRISVELKNFSEFYQNMIESGCKIKISNNKFSKNTIVVGTPNQYLDFIASE